MKSTITIKRIVACLMFLLIVAVVLPNLPRAKADGMTVKVEWDALGFLYLAFLCVPLLCVWFGAKRNHVVEGFGWLMLLFLVIAAFTQ